jgi:hypothetical protein
MAVAISNLEGCLPRFVLPRLALIHARFAQVLQLHRFFYLGASGTKTS